MMKIGAIIQVRNNSVRLPGKVLMPLPFPNGDSLLFHITKGIRNCEKIDDIYLATTKSKIDDNIESFGLDNSIKVYRGSQNNVLSRFINIVEMEDYDHVIRFTGDNPFVDIKKLEEAIDFHIKNENDYTKTAGLPLGMNFEIIKAKALILLKNYHLTDSDKEHVTLFFGRTDIFKKSIYQIKEYDGIEDLRLTVDYPSDYAMASILFSIPAKSGMSWLDFITEIKKENPWVFNINSLNIQNVPL